MMESKINILADDISGVRIDSFLKEELNLSRSKIKNMIIEGQISVNDMMIKPSYVINKGDRIVAHIVDEEEKIPFPENISLDIRYEDDDLIIINKPKGMVVHQSPGHYTGTMVNALLYHCGNSLSRIDTLRPGIVHRIDKDTTGLIMACKNDKAHDIIASQLKEHSINREYKAIACGYVSEDGIIDKPLSRDKNNRLRRGVDDLGDRAVTRYSLICRLKNLSYISCKLETGRTHQIRAHMSYIKHPLLGDTLYGGWQTKYNNGQVLHASLLGFIHPRNNKYMEFQEDIPNYFKEIIRAKSF